jgi:glycosyltransferase involved in cell wall biosynthesis
MSKPVVHYYSTCWNEEYLLPHFLRHYAPFVDRFVIFDDGSTDRSIDILQREPTVETRPTNRRADEPYIHFNTALYNNAWKESRGQADWVIVGNIDEFIYGRDVASHLATCHSNGITAIPLLGFEMISRDDLPAGKSPPAAVRSGAPSAPMSRWAIFNPDAIEEINYGVGRHTCRPTGDIVIPDKDRLLNLHFKRVGLARTFQRQRLQDTRRSITERRQGLGHHYEHAWPQFLADWEKVERDAFDVLEWYASGAAPKLAPWWRDSRKMTPTPQETVMDL